MKYFKLDKDELRQGMNAFSEIVGQCVSEYQMQWDSATSVMIASLKMLLNSLIRFEVWTVVSKAGL
jgi:hypothetical protein